MSSKKSSVSSDVIVDGTYIVAVESEVEKEVLALGSLFCGIVALLQAIVWLQDDCAKRAKADKEDKALATANNKANREREKKG